MTPEDVGAALRAPFAADEIRWRVGQVAKEQQGKKRRASLLAYLDARAVMDRLDAVVGSGGWQDSYRPGPDGGLICRLEILVGDRWVGKEDAAENTAVEAVKGGVSDAFKRAAVKWGVGRYLYSLDAAWHEIQDGWANGRGIDVAADKAHLGFVPWPQLPAWAIPAPAGKAAPQPQAQSVAVEQPAAYQHHPSWEAHKTRFMLDLREIGWTYDEVVAVLESLSPPKPRPSTIPTAQREALLRWLSGAAAKDRRRTLTADPEPGSAG